MKRVRKLLAAILILGMVATCFGSTSFTSQAAKKYEVKNVIFMIGDGMGDGAIEAGRMRRSDLHLDKFDKMGYLNTNTIDDKLTDSAAGGTALATGVRTKVDVVGLDKDGNKSENLSEWMKGKSKKIGLVSTCYIVDATPAAFAAHTSSRKNYADIAKAMVDLEVDVIMGGGQSQFDYAIDNNGTTVSGIQYAKTVGDYEYITTKSDLDTVTGDKKVLGLFAKSYLEYTEKKNKDVEPNLAELTEKTLELLENDNGFFAMIEGGRIDGAAHNNATANLQDAMLEFDDAIKVAMDYADSHEGTLIVVTADHETGGVAVGSTVSGPQVQFSTGDHTKAPVPYYVYGAGIEHFEGLSMNIDIAPAIKKAVEEGSIVNSGAGSNSGSQGSGGSGSNIFTEDELVFDESLYYDTSVGTGTPHTGDSNMTFMWCAIFVVCGGLVAVSIVTRRKKENSI